MLNAVEYSLQINRRNESSIRCKLILGGNSDFNNYEIASKKYFSDEGVFNLVKSLNRNTVEVYKNLYFLVFLKDPNNKSKFGRIPVTTKEEKINIKVDEISEIIFIEAKKPIYDWLCFEISELPIEKIRLLEKRELINFFPIPLGESMIHGYLIFNFDIGNEENELKELAMKYEPKLKEYLNFKNDSNEYLSNLRGYEREIEPVKQEFLKKNAILIRYMGTTY